MERTPCAWIRVFPCRYWGGPRLVALRCGWLFLAFRGQDPNRARQRDREQLHGKAALIIAIRPRGGYAGPGVPRFRLLHVVADVVRGRVAVVHEVLSLFCDPDSPRWRGKNFNLLRVVGLCCDQSFD